MGIITFKNSSPCGDLVSLLPSIRQLYRVTGKKGVIFQALNVVGQGIQGYDQPFKNSNGESIMMGEEMFQMIIPLLKAQEYIEDVLVYKGQEVDYDLDEMRLKTFTNQPLGSINRWSFYVFPEMACDLSEAWICSDTAYKSFTYSPINDIPYYHDTAIINFTDRYRNNWINYFFLKEYESKLVFAGLPQEHDFFCKKWGLNIKLLEFQSFKGLATALNSCKFFMGNASMCYQIAEGLKIPRLLETYQLMPNVIPFGKSGYDAYHQEAMEFYFKKLIS